MVLRHFNLREQPFGVTPDPRYLFGTATHREALAALLYGIESGLGFISLIANPGMGKTTILFEALARLNKKVRTVFLFQAVQTPTDLLRALLIDLGESNPPASIVDLETRLNEILLEQSKTGTSLVLVIDEAQNLDRSVLEAVRMLSNFETPSRKLLQIVLCGQVQLAERLADPELLQLRQRISIFACLTALSPIETGNYIRHRLQVAGYAGTQPLFNPGAVDLIARHSGGIPRNINNLCFNALSIGCALRKDTIDAAIVREVIDDLKVNLEARTEQIAIRDVAPEQNRPTFSERMRSGWPRFRVAAIAFVLFAAATIVGDFVLARSGVDLLGSLRAKTPAAQTPPAQNDANLLTPVAAPEPQPATYPARSAEQTLAPPPADPAAQPVPPSQAQAQPANSTAASPAQSGKTSRQRRRRGIAAHRGRPFAAPGSAIQLVEVHRRQSLSSMCAEQFGDCGPSLLARIVKLNPQIADPNHLEPGKKVIMPVAVSTPEDGSYAPAGG